MKTEKFILPRTGDRPLTFRGKLLKAVSSRQHQGACQNRYWGLTLYRTESDKFVLRIHYNTQWQGEHDTDTVMIASTPAKLAERLRAHNFLAGCYGFPRGHEERQQQLEKALTACWDKAVSELLSVLEPEEL